MTGFGLPSTGQRGCGTFFLLCKLTENYVVSNAKIKQALGIDKMPVSAQEGMRKTLDSFK